MAKRKIQPKRTSIKVECLNPQVCVACEHCTSVDKSGLYVFVECALVRAIHLDPDFLPVACLYVTEHTVSQVSGTKGVAHAGNCDRRMTERELLLLDLVMHKGQATKKGLCEACRRPWCGKRCACGNRGGNGVRDAQRALERLKSLGVEEIGKRRQEVWLGTLEC